MAQPVLSSDREHFYHIRHSAFGVGRSGVVFAKGQLSDYSDLVRELADFDLDFLADTSEIDIARTNWPMSLQWRIADRAYHETHESRTILSIRKMESVQRILHAQWNGTIYKKTPQRS